MSTSPPLATGDPLLIAAPLEWREACFSLPAVRALAAMGVKVQIFFPEPQLSFWQAAGFEGSAFPPSSSARKIAAQLKGTERMLLWESGPVLDGARKAGVTIRIGPRDEPLEKQLTHLTGPRPQPGPPEHRVARYLKLVEELGAQPYVAANFAALDVSGQRNEDSLLLIPDSDFGAHFEWPLERWIELARECIAAGEALEIGQAPDAGRKLGGKLAAALELPLVNLETPALGELGARARCLGADSSLMHLAAAAGVACSVMFGPGDPALHRPLGRQHRLIRRKVECSPCFAARCPLDLRCQLDLTVAEVLRQLGALSDVA